MEASVVTTLAPRPSRLVRVQVPPSPLPRRPQPAHPLAPSHHRPSLFPSLAGRTSSRSNWTAAAAFAASTSGASTVPRISPLARSKTPRQRRFIRPLHLRPTDHQGQGDPREASEPAGREHDSVLISLCPACSIIQWSADRCLAPRGPCVDFRQHLVAKMAPPSLAAVSETEIGLLYVKFNVGGR